MRFERTVASFLVLRRQWRCRSTFSTVSLGTFTPVSARPSRARARSRRRPRPRAGGHGRDRDAAGADHHVGGIGQRRAHSFQRIRHVAQQRVTLFGQPAAAQRAVGVVDMVFREGLAGLRDLVAGDQHRDARARTHRNLGDAEPECRRWPARAMVSPSRSTISWRATVSAPGGSAPPVKMRMASPDPTGCFAASPAAISPTSFSGATESAARRAQPSTALLRDQRQVDLRTRRRRQHLAQRLDTARVSGPGPDVARVLRERGFEWQQRRLAAVRDVAAVVVPHQRMSIV